MAAVIYNLTQQDVPDEIVPALVERGLIYKDDESDVYVLETMPKFLASPDYSEITAGEAWKRLDEAVNELTKEDN